MNLLRLTNPMDSHVTAHGFAGYQIGLCFNANIARRKCRQGAKLTNNISRLERVISDDFTLLRLLTAAHVG